ncbi:serine/threonine-protein kinase [Dokdonella sp.]|uniref:serine/threonine-protein kinase n=1 Tax=Dokdonella sp. TaxID=2291710 RepID=UPI001B276920|nr:serine/threonine-protein kinase [Dokdonella sp.]MBO9661706.1 protein kinase [Dokdonella sp.]
MEQSVLARDRHAYSLFRGLLELAPAEREARIGELARDDPKLAATMRAMIADAESEGDDEDDATGRLIGGRFRVLRRLGTGGMGEVYLAERADDVQQQVAVKLVRGALPAARARRERQILGRLNHPHIASLIDAGVMANGRPWFAMDYVEGESVVVACDRLALGLQARARLLAQVARAVQFAHKNLILHRDLKPSNILVDTEGAPRLLDFGIAKFLDATDVQETQTFAMTPAYASPEQLRGETATTASDIHQLGLVLYELACGIPAHKAREAAGRGAVALPRPDHALAALVLRDRAEAERIARHRGLSLDKLRKASKGDLARVIAKATADEPHERYDTAQALADDLERWAAGLPVAAHRGSFAYRLRKLVRRHAIAVAAIVSLGLGLIAATLVAVDRARTEHRQREQTEQQRQRAETLLGFLRDVFREADPNSTDGATLDASELLRRAGAKLGQNGELDAPVQGVLSTEIASVFASLGRRADALAAAERAERELRPLQSQHPIDYLRSVEILSNALREAGRSQEIVDLVDRTLPLATATFDPSRRWRGVLLFYRGDAKMVPDGLDAAEADLRASLADYREASVSEGQDLAATLNGLAHIAYLKMDARQSLDWLRQQQAAVASDPHADKLDALMLQKSIAQVHSALLGDAKTAIGILEPLVGRFDALLGKSHDRSIDARLALAMAYLSNGDGSKADEIIKALDVFVDARTDFLNPITRQSLLQVRARLALFEGDAKQALKLLQEGIRPSEPKVQSLQWLLGEALLQDGQVAAAQAQLQQTLAEVSAKYGEAADPLRANLADSLGRCRLLQGDYDGAETYFDEAVAQYLASQGADAPGTLRSEIHRLWARALVTRERSLLNALQVKRDDLVRALGSAGKLQVRQVDLLIDHANRELAGPAVEVGARERAEIQLDASAGVTRNRHHYSGLTSFY